MCILLFALEQYPQYPVIICANRDEFHQRPTKAMHHWLKPAILAGKDLTAGGTWLGLTASGRFSALTNFRQVEQVDNNKKSRGNLVIQALTQTDKNISPLLHESADDYNGYNLVYGQLNKLYSFDSVNKKTSQLAKGIHSLCNGPLDNIWPKMALGQQKLSALINNFSKNDNLDIDQLFYLMKNAQQAKIEQLPKTGISKQWEKFLSAIFIVSPEYGTRTTTIITQDINGKIFIADRSYNALGNVTLEQQFTIAYKEN
jgi:uncharacterized protein with NRDE domain